MLIFPTPAPLLALRPISAHGTSAIGTKSRHVLREFAKINPKTGWTEGDADLVDHFRHRTSGGDCRIPWCSARFYTADLCSCRWRSRTCCSLSPCLRSPRCDRLVCCHCCGCVDYWKISHCIGINSFIVFFACVLFPGVGQELSSIHDQLCRLFGDVEHNASILVVVMGHIATRMTMGRAICMRVRGALAVVVNQVVFARTRM